MQDFDTIKTTLLKHLPRPHAGSNFSVSLDEITVAEPGISVGDVAAMLEELSGEEGFLPQDLPVRDIRLETLSLRRATDQKGAEFSCALVWSDQSIPVTDHFPLKMGRVEFSKVGSRLSAHAEVEIRLDDMDLELKLDLPSQFITGELAPEKHDTAAEFLAARNLAQAGGSMKLVYLAVTASIPFRYLSVHVEIEDVFTIGPVSLSRAMAELELSDAEAAAEIEAEVRVAIDGHDPLVIQAQGQVDHHGWRVAGAIGGSIGDFTIGHLAGSLATSLRTSAPDLPAILNDLAVTHIAASIDTHSDTFQLDCTLHWAHDADLVLHLEKVGPDLVISGSLTMDETVFKVTFQDKGGKILVATYDAAGHAEMTLDTLIAALSGGSAPFGKGGSGVQLGVKSVALALDPDAKILMAAQLSAGVDLSRLGDLPLIGTLLDTDKPLGLELTPSYLAKGFASDALTEVQALLPENLSGHGDFTEGFSISPRLLLGDEVITLDALSLGGSPHDGKAPQLPQTGKPSAGAPPLPADTEITWKDIDHSLGPLHIGRVGYGFDKNGPQIDLAFDASLAIAGLEVSVEGFGARYNFETQELVPRLQGLGVDLKRGPLEIGGAFLNSDGDFLGEIMVGTPQFALKALGGFSMINGTPSMFVYGVLNMPLGGPAFFFVDGLAAGFGVHRKIRIPKIDEIHDFPLIASAVEASITDNASTSTDAAASQLAALHSFVTPKLGEYFFAAGVKFNSFKLLDGFAVLIVSLGDDFEVDVIGTAHFATPPELPDDVPALAKIELDLMARYIASEGLISVEARLNPHSYVYGPMCHLSGGFAFYTWLKDNPAAGITSGDFVLSVGGYHPQFKRPDHYPVVPRVELKYQVTPDVYIKGEAYFALTPSILMAGGALHLQANIGDLQAWADLSVDFLVGWEPFHYDAAMHIEIGAKWKSFHTSASADLHIWGPSFSGIASVDWWVFSFDIEFGETGSSAPRAITLSKFKSSFLDCDNSADSQARVLGCSPTSGVIGDINGVANVTPAELAINLSSKVPILSVEMGSRNHSFSGTTLGVAPSNLSDIGASRLKVTVRSDDGTDVTGQFEFAHQEGGFPAALWGRAIQIDQNADPIKAINGVTLTPAEGLHVGASEEAAVKDLQPLNQPQVSWARSSFAQSPPDILPTELPLDDLAALGLATDDLVYVTPKKGTQSQEAFA